jgi:hypothetical protein
MENAFRQVKDLSALLNECDHLEQANMGAKNHAILMPDGQKLRHPFLFVFSEYYFVL